jgi:hypothetical protein
VVREYVRDVKLKLGVSDRRQVWSMRDWTRRLKGKFGRYTGMWRLHHMSSEILQLLLENNADVATAYVVQLQKVLVQMVSDAGSWETAVLLWPIPDPLSSESFGGTEQEMQQIHRYRRAVTDLRQKHNSFNKEQPLAEGEEAADGGGPQTTRRPRGGRGRGRGAAKED